MSRFEMILTIADKLMDDYGKNGQREDGQLACAVETDIDRNGLNLDDLNILCQTVQKKGYNVILRVYPPMAQMTVLLTKQEE